MRIDIAMGHTEPLPVLRTLIISDNIAKGIFTMVSKRKPYKTFTLYSTDHRKSKVREIKSQFLSDHD